jgi:hypothetical protein
VETLIKEKKEKENVLKNLQLINLKSASLFNYEKFKNKTTKVEIEKLVEANKECHNPSLGLATKARACKVAGQEGSPGVTSHAMGILQGIDYQNFKQDLLQLPKRQGTIETLVSCLCPSFP